MSLESIVDNSRTDKNTIHSYLPLYQKLFGSKQETAKSILEIGIWNGGSIKLWHDFFPNATVYGLDIIDPRPEWNDIINTPGIILNKFDAYNPEVVNQYFIQPNIRFDIMIDDGPHSLDSMKKYIQLYLPLMTDDGILIIEDIPSVGWIEILRQTVPEHQRQFVKVYDLRHIKNRYDDIVFTIDKYNRP
jgi:cephalosporin hydroxylase